MIVLSERAAGARRAVYFCRKKITISDLLFHPPNLQALAEVYNSCILSTMSDQNTGKLNLLLAELGDTRLISSRWLRAHGYSNSLVARYVSSGWLVSPVRGVYMRKGGHLQWEGVVRSLQVGEGVPLHVGGRFSLSLQGHEHYLRLGDAGTITLYGPGRSPGWLDLVAAPRFLASGGFGNGSPLAVGWRRLAAFCGSARNAETPGILADPGVGCDDAEGQRPMRPLPWASRCSTATRVSTSSQVL